MPPKKKDDKKQDGKKGKSKVKKDVKGPPEPEVLSDETKDYYVVQIKDLVSRVEKYQKLCDELRVKNQEYNERFDQLIQDKRDIVSHIKKQIEDKTNEIADLTEQLLGLQEAKDLEKETFEQQLQQLRTEYHETRDRLSSENMTLNAKLASLEEFKLQRADLMAKLAALEKQLYDQDLLHKTKAYEMERKQVIDKDVLKREMIQRVNQVAAEFRKASNRQMAETTKRTIRENISINTQLTKISDTTEELVSENKQLREKTRAQRQLIEQLTETEQELARKNVSNQKVIRALLDRCQRQAEMLEEAGLRDQEMRDLEAQYENLKDELERSQPEMAAMAMENERLEEQVKRVGEEYKERVALRRRIEQTLLEAASALKSIIMATPGEYCNETEEDLRATREGLLESLLLVLNNAAICEGVAEATAADAPANRVSSIGDPSRGRPLADHYRLGDLGFIPRPYDHISTSLEKMQAAERKARELKDRAIAYEEGTARRSAKASRKMNDFADRMVCKYGRKSEGVGESDTVPTLPPLTPSSSKFNGVC